MTAHFNFDNQPTESISISPMAGQGSALTTTIIVPCYNEAARLDADAFVAFVDATPHVQFLFVDDGSVDNTLDVLRALHRRRAHRIMVLALSQNSGKAEAVRQGLIHATRHGADLIGYWDADLATPLDAIPDFLRVAHRFHDVEVVFGSRRALLGHRIERTIVRRMISRISATLARMVLRMPIGDTQCGAKMLRNSPALRKAIAEPFTAGWLFDVELFARVSQHLPSIKGRYYELPLMEWTEVPGSKVSSRAVLRSGVQMLRLIAEARLGLSAGLGSTKSTTAAILLHAAEPKTDDINPLAAA